MTYAPDTLRAARSLLLDQLDIHPTGSYPADLDPAEVGIVGDTAHAAKGTSYHLGEDQLTDTAYSRRTARDRAGLTNAASAVDIGTFKVTTAKGTFTQRDLAVWSVQQCQANHPDTRDIREIIYTADGRVVLRYDRERGYASDPRPGEADDSHLTHDHYSQYRDAEHRYTLRDHYARWLRHIGLLEGDDMTQLYIVKGTLPVYLYDGPGRRHVPDGATLKRVQAATGLGAPVVLASQADLDLIAPAPRAAGDIDQAALKALIQEGVRAELDKTRLGPA